MNLFDVEPALPLPLTDDNWFLLMNVFISDKKMQAQNVNFYTALFLYLLILKKIVEPAS